MRPPGHRPRATGLATAAAVLGTLALLAVVLTLGVLFFIALPVGLVAAIMAIVARRRGGGGLATVGLVTGSLATFLSLLVLALVVVVITALNGIDLQGLPDVLRDLLPEDLERELDRQLRDVPDDTIQENPS